MGVIIINVCNRLKYVREHFKLSQSEVGEKIGVSKAAISSLELGKYNLSQSMLILYSEKLGVSQLWLETGVGEMFEESTLGEKLASAIGRQIKTDDPYILESLLRLAELSTEEWNVINKVFGGKEPTL